MITGSVNIDKSLASLKTVEAQFRANGRNAVIKTARAYVGRIIDNTKSSAPPPPVKYYVRTNRLIGGWLPAANYLGLSVPGFTGKIKDKRPDTASYVEVTDNSDVILFRATNGVRYVRPVEEIGTWGPGRVFRGGYWNVLKARQATQAEFEENVVAAWSIS